MENDKSWTETSTFMKEWRMLNSTDTACYCSSYIYIQYDEDFGGKLEGPLNMEHLGFANPDCWSS